MQRYSKLVAIFLAAFAVAIALPAAAAAGCPGCEEYTLDIPENDGGGDGTTPAPAPAAPTTPTAPATPTTPATTDPSTPTTPATTVPTAPVAETEPKPKPEDTDPDPVPDSAAAKPLAADLPAAAASQTRELAGPGGDTGGLLPLALAMAAVAVVAGAVGFRRRGADPETAETRS